MSDTVMNLDKVSLFQMPVNYTKANESDKDVDMLLIYRYDVPTRSEKIQTLNSSIPEMNKTFTSTLLNRTFYQNLWKIQIIVNIPIVYRGDTMQMKLQFDGQIYFSLLMQYKLDVSFVD